MYLLSSEYTRREGTVDSSIGCAHIGMHLRYQSRDFLAVDD